MSVKLETKNKTVSKRFAFNEKWNSIKRDYALYIMLAPFLLFFIVFLYKPMYGLQIVFKDLSISNLYQGIEASPWVGFQNFKDFFGGPYFKSTLTNTFMVSVYSLIFGFPMPIILALVFNEVKNKKFKTIGQTITYLPHFISVVVVAGIVTNFLAPENGLVNILITAITGSKSDTYFLMQKEYIRTIYISMNIWKETGFSAVIYISALASIDTEQYEAATVDGANRFKQLLFITLPSLMPTIATMLILRIGNLLSVGYETILLLYQPSTYEKIDIINTYVYREGIVGGNFSLTATAGLFNSVVSLVLVFFSNIIVKKLTDTGIW